MSGITRKQARLIKRQISKLYRRNYIPLTTPDSTLSIGDVLEKKNDILEFIDGSIFDSNNIEFNEGNKINMNIISSSETNISLKLKGESILSELFKVEEAGLSINFSSSNEMLLKAVGLRQQNMKNFADFRKELLSKYVAGELSSKVYVVRGLVYADKFYLQYSGEKGGGIAFNIDTGIKGANAEVDADFSLKWKKNVGFHINGLNGGVLAYRVSGVRLKRHLITQKTNDNILRGVSEADVLSTISFKERKELLKNDMLEVVDLTAEALI